VIILDTNVLSELSRQAPSKEVLSWLDAQPADEIATTAVTVGEILYGVARLPDGRRKTELAQAVQGMVDDDLRGRVEPFDVTAAAHYAAIVSGREKIGRPISTADAQIASICRKLQATLATRNTRDFEDAGIDVIDPWQPRRPGRPGYSGC
jgi:predicted nucleic acid-binding protein